MTKRLVVAIAVMAAATSFVVFVGKYPKKKASTAVGTRAESTAPNIGTQRPTNALIRIAGCEISAQAPDAVIEPRVFPGERNRHPLQKVFFLEVIVDDAR